MVGLVVACSAPPATTPSASLVGASPRPGASAATAAPTTGATAAPTPAPIPGTIPGTIPAATPIVLPSVAQISAPSATVVWALVAGTRLFRSTDRGDTWQERPLPAQPANPLVSFIDDHEGWLATTGSPATQCQSQSIGILHTVDAGVTWQPLNVSGIDAAQCKNSLTFTDGTHGFVTTYALNSEPLVYRSTDGGQRWTPSAQFPQPASGQRPTDPAPVVVSLRSFGGTPLADVAGESWHDAYRSTDGGATWTYASTAPNQGDPIAFVTATRWIQIGAPGASSETTDGGANWDAFATDYQQAAPIPPAFTFGDAQVGYATVRGAIQRTIDGGATWSTIATPGTS
jgi:photosystem II stability/assembly factor-like uncharacterized protein